MTSKRERSGDLTAMQGRQRIGDAKKLPLDDAGSTGKGRIKKKFLELPAPDVAQQPEMKYRKEFETVVALALPNLSEGELSAFIDEGYRRNDAALRAATYELKSAAQPDHPLMYSERPPGMKFEDWIRREYIAKGVWRREGFTLNSLREIDEDFARAYQQQSYRKDLPDDLRLPKATAHTNKREREARRP